MINNLFQRFQKVKGGNIFELGIFGGGSTAFIAKVAKPKKLVSIELEPDPIMPLQKFISQEKLQDTVKCYYGIDQSDKNRVKEIANREFQDSLDIVIDDASHFYQPTKMSFEVLFPLLRCDGLYMLEDWSWEHTIANTLAYIWDDGGAPEPVSGPTPASESIIKLTHDQLRSKEKTFMQRLVRILYNVNNGLANSLESQCNSKIENRTSWTPLSQLVLELILLRALSPGVIQDIHVGQHFVTVRRGNQPIDTESFQVSSEILNCFGQLALEQET